MEKNYQRSVVYNPGSQKVKPRPTKSSIPWFYIFLIIVSVGISISFLVLQAGISSLNYEIETVQREIDVLEKANRGLRLQLAEKTNLREIEKRARQELAMVRPEQQDYIVMAKPELQTVERTDREGTFELNLAGFFGELAQWVRERATVAAGALGE